MCHLCMSASAPGGPNATSALAAAIETAVWKSRSNSTRSPRAYAVFFFKLTLLRAEGKLKALLRPACMLGCRLSEFLGIFSAAAYLYNR